MANEKLTNLLDDMIQTKNEADVFVAQLDDVIDASYNKKLPFEKALEQCLSRTKKEKIWEYIQNNSVAVNTHEDIKQFLESMKQTLLLKPVIALTIAFEPKQDTFTRMKTWCYTSFNTMPLLAITIDPAILAGCIVRTQGYYKDYSLKKTLQTKKEFILEKFSHYA